MYYTLIRSDRRSLSVSVGRGGTVTVRAPYSLSEKEIAFFLDQKKHWIAEQVRRMSERGADVFSIPAERIPTVKKGLAEELKPLMERYTALTGLRPESVRITCAKTRLGSCSGKNTVNFSVYLYNFPLEVKEYVVLHELAHIAHKNHGAAFYALIARYMPDYKTRVRQIKNI